ncbi:MAG: hypothetical protein R3C56_38560 [Pirellulaceae bacterium]
MRTPTWGCITPPSEEADIGKFRTPPLRYVSYTAPYILPVSWKRLEDVIEFYNSGGGDSENKSPLLKPLELTEDEVRILLRFHRVDER